MPLDTVDRRLLAILQNDARTPIAKLAEEAGASTASIQRRLKRMREDGTIQREVALVNPAVSDAVMSFIVLIEVERDTLDRLEDFRRRARAERAVQQCYCVAGETDFVLIVQARDMVDYEAFTHRFFFNDANVRRFRTSVVITRDKCSLNSIFET